MHLVVGRVCGLFAKAPGREGFWVDVKGCRTLVRSTPSRLPRASQEDAGPCGPAAQTQGQKTVRPGYPPAEDTAQVGRGRACLTSLPELLILFPLGAKTGEQGQRIAVLGLWHLCPERWPSIRVISNPAVSQRCERAWEAHLGSL